LRFAGKRGVLTFKGAPLHSHEYKIRKEIETGIEDGDRLREILESLGLREIFRYDKYRTVYRFTRSGAGTSTLAYDETPIGNYLELEGSRRWIDGVARQLGYRRADYITASYGALYRQKCLQRGEKPENMVFPAHESLEQQS
jgi:adenylate cyclase class 2